MIPPPSRQVSDDTLGSIFRSILDWHLRSYPPALRSICPSVIAATLEVYSQSMVKLLPTPTKSHYTFNLRDFARVIQVLGSISDNWFEKHFVSDHS